VEYGFNPARCHDRVESKAIGEFSDHEFRVLRDGLAMAVTQVIEDDNFVPCL
jgi:hypothetical protein